MAVTGFVSEILVCMHATKDKIKGVITALSHCHGDLLGHNNGQPHHCSVITGVSYGTITLLICDTAL